jgi:PadR family transcriptional regulator, regulatory protein PadR
MGNGSPRLTAQTLKLLGAFMNSESEELSGADIAKRTSLQTGTLYPILVRLEQAKWLESRWEEGDPKLLGRPRRRLYRVTGLGVKSARAAFREIAEISGGIAWVSS